MTRWAVALSAVAFLFLGTVATQVYAAASCNEPVPGPKYEVGDKWTWRDEKGREWNNTVEQVEGEMAQIKWPGGGMATYNKDWIVVQVRKTNGELVTRQGAGQYLEVGQKILEFPLQTGKTWDTTYLSTPMGGSLSQNYLRSKIIGCEEVRVPAGTFSAFKIEVNQGRVGMNWNGTYYWWYAPQVKNRVKRQYVPSQYWHTTNDYELIKFETK